jgi:hypothetical protein
MANHLVIGDVVRNQRNLIMQGAGRDPGVRGLNRTPFAAGFPGDLRPFRAQFSACRKDHIIREMLSQLRLPRPCPIALQRPSFQLGKCHKGNAEKTTADMSVIPKCTGVALEDHRHDVRVYNRRIHREAAGGGPSWRHSRSIAAKSSTDSSSVDGCPSRASNLITGPTPCDAASSSNEGVSEFDGFALLCSRSTV